MQLQLQEYGPAIDQLKKQLEKDPDNIELLAKLVELYLKVEGDDYYNSVITLDKILEIDPTNLFANRVRALIYQDQDNYEKALECYKVIVDNFAYANNHPDYMEIKFDYAETLEHVDREEEALEIYETLYQQNPQAIPTLFKLAHVYELLDRPDDAILKYNEILKLDPENIPAHNQLIELYEETDKKLYYLTKAEMAEKEDDYDRAISNYKKLLGEAEAPEEVISARKKIANIYFTQNKLDKALDEYNLALNEDPEDSDIYKGLGKVFFEQDEFDACIENFLKVTQLNPQDFDAYVYLAECYTENKDYANALKELEVAVRLKPENLDIHCAIADACISLRDLYRAKQELDFVKARETKNTRALGLIVDLKLEQENFEEALASAKELVTLLPNSVYSARKLGEVYRAMDDPYNASYNFGLAYEIQGEYGMAIDEYAQAYELDKSNAELLMKIGDLYMSLDETYIGIEYYENATDVDPSNIVALTKLAQFYMNKEEYEKAMEVYSRLTEVDKRNPEAFFNLAKLYEKQKYYEDALETYRKFLDIAPTSAKVGAVKRKIASIEKKLHGSTTIVDADLADSDNEKTILQRLIGLFTGK